MVREALIERQRRFAGQDGGAVLDGRDIGTVIAPDAGVKLFVTASPEVLPVELRRGRPFSEEAERVASRIGGALLFALAAYVVIAAGWNLWQRHGEDFSWPGLVVTLLAMPAMRYLAVRKLDIAGRLGSRALRADAMEAITCGWLSFVAVVSLAAQALLGKSFKVTQHRGRFVDSPLAPRVTATVHPSSILRAPDEESRRTEMKRFVEDLERVAAELG